MKYLSIALLLLSVGCVDTLQDAAHPPGEMNANGRIYPCHGWEGDKQLCGNSKFFAKVIGQVEIGHATDDVRAIMMRDPWRRELRTTNGVAEELWGYPTSYEDERMVWIVFLDGLVAELRESAWEDEDD